VSYQPQPSLAVPPPLDQPYYGIGFGGAVGRGFKKYATFTGRASRSEYGGGFCSPSSAISFSDCWPSPSARQPHGMEVGLLDSSRYR
jgi:hypothetical protein